MKIPAHIEELRREVCSRSCRDQCSQFKDGTLDVSDHATACPRAWVLAWGCYGPCDGPLPKPTMGLGDAVAKVAQPIAKAIDAVLGTNVQGCGGCKQRQAALNKLVPRL